MPSLLSIHLDNYALDGDVRSDRKGIPSEPFNWKNTLPVRSNHCVVYTFVDLPSLISFYGNDYHIRYFGSVTLEGVFSLMVRHRHSEITRE